MTVFGPPAAGTILREALAPFKDLGVLGATTTRSRQPRRHRSHVVQRGRAAGHRRHCRIRSSTSRYTWHTNLDTYERDRRRRREEVGDCRSRRPCITWRCATSCCRGSPRTRCRAGRSSSSRNSRSRAAPAAARRARARLVKGEQMMNRVVGDRAGGRRLVSMSGHDVGAASGAQGPTVQVYKSPTCGCCAIWVKHLQAQRLHHARSPRSRTSRAIKTKHNIPARAQSCHTAIVDGYVLEGHVPAADVQRLLKERPAVARPRGAGHADRIARHGSPERQAAGRTTWSRSIAAVSSRSSPRTKASLGSQAVGPATHAYAHYTGA